MTLREAGFDFARQLRNPDFRAALREAGHNPDGTETVWIEEAGRSILPTLQEEGPGSYFVATADDAFEHGFRFCRIEIAGPLEEQ